jgi:hypothetical protein
MTEKKTIKLDLDHANNIAHTGVRRAALFMGLGLNAAHRDDFNDYQLNKLPIVPGQTNLPMDFLPRDLPNERVEIFKKQFAQWITACGLRELIEHYALFLDKIHTFALVASAIKGKLGDLDPRKAEILFNGRFGVPRKLDTLRSRFGVSVAEADSIKSLYEARNCLTHDLGEVLPKRCTNGGKFYVSWKALEVFVKGDETGTEQPIVAVIGKATSESSSIFARVVQRERHLSAHDRLVFSQQDLWEICFFFSAHAIPSMMKAFVGFLEELGVRVDSSEAASDKTPDTRPLSPPSS